MKGWNSDILYSFIPDDKKDSFVTWDNVIDGVDGFTCFYRCWLYTERMFVSKTDYDSKVRDLKIKSILD